MYKDLSPNVKISITRSITQTFEQYMNGIDWNPEKSNVEDFIKSWKEYITTKALWYSEIPANIKESGEFQQQLADQVNKTLERIFNDPPTEEQIANIQMLQEQLNTYIEYDCKLHAAYVERVLENRVKASE